MMARLMLALMLVVAGCREDAPRIGCEEVRESSCLCRPLGDEQYLAFIYGEGDYEGSGIRRSVHADRMLLDSLERLQFGAHSDTSTQSNRTELVFTQLLGPLAQVDVGWRRGRLHAQAGSLDVVALQIERRGRHLSWTAGLYPQEGQPSSVAMIPIVEWPGEDRTLSNSIRETLEPLPLCRCDEVEDIVRDAQGALTASRCRREGATTARLRVDYGPRGLPLRIEEDRGDLPPVTVPPTLTSLPGPRAHPPVAARTRAIVMRWTADGWLESVHGELDGRRYGLAVELGPTSIRLGWYFDDVAVGLWIETDADGLPAHAIDHGPTGGEARELPIVKPANP